MYQEFYDHCIIIIEWGVGVEDGIGRWWLIYIRVWMGGQGKGIIL